MKNRRNRCKSTSSPDWQRFWKESSTVHAENAEYDSNGRGKAPNLKKISAFYKKWDKFRRLRGRR